MSPDVQLVSVIIEDTKIQITRYLNDHHEDLYNPSVIPHFLIRVLDETIQLRGDSEPFRWTIIMPPEGRIFYKADPRAAILTGHKKTVNDVALFHEWLPVYETVRIANSNWLARAAKKKVQKWIRNEFMSSQIEAR